jgi:hypothetical protein
MPHSPRVSHPSRSRSSPRRRSSIPPARKPPPVTKEFPHFHQLLLISHYPDYLISAPSVTPEFKHLRCRILRAFRIPAEADRLPGVDRWFLRLGNLPSYERASAPPPVAASSDRFPPILTNHFVSTIVHYTMRENRGCVGYMNCHKILYL